MSSSPRTPNLVPHVLYEPEDTGILWIRLNRPERMNATATDTVEKVAEYMKCGAIDLPPVFMPLAELELSR